MAADTGGTVKGEVTIVEPSRNQRSIARRVAEAKATVPEHTLQSEADVSAALDDPAGLAVLAVKAAGLALRDVPAANASYRDGRFERYARINVGLTVFTGDGPVVPTLLDADRRTVAELAADAAALAQRAQAGAITAAELGGATFTVSDLGAHGVGAYAAVLQPPQAAALALGAPIERPVVRGDAVVVRRLAMVTLTCDHRILYGADAAALLAAIIARLETPELLA